MQTSVLTGSGQTISEDGQLPFRAVGSESDAEGEEESGSVSEVYESDPEALEAHEEANNEGGEGGEEFFEASPEALAQPESEESAAGDLVSEGLELTDGGESGAEGGEGEEMLPEAGTALGGQEFIPLLVGLAAKVGPMLLSTAGPALARAVMSKLSPKAKRLLAKKRPGGDMVSVLQKLMTQATKRQESEEEATPVDEALVEEMTATIEVIIGTDDRIRIKNTVKVPWRRYCALRIEFPTGAVYRGTGFFIGDRVLATAGHCVYMHSQGGWARRIQVIPACNGSQKPFGAAYATSFKSTVGWTKSKTAAADYGAIILPSNAFPGQKFGKFALRAFASNALLAVPAVVAGYPGDKPFAEMWGMKRKIKAATALNLVYDIDTMGGQSGAPVYIRQGGKRFVVGIHNYGASSGNSATRVTPAVIANFKKWGAIGAKPTAPPSGTAAPAASSKTAKPAQAQTMSGGLAIASDEELDT